jgi:hypothetical protein
MCYRLIIHQIIIIADWLAGQYWSSFLKYFLVAADKTPDDLPDGAAGALAGIEESDPPHPVSCRDRRYTSYAASRIRVCELLTTGERVRCVTTRGECAM